jgi:hypothetical protein
LCRRVDLFCQKSTRSGLQPLPNVVMQRQKRDTSIKTYLMSPLKRALIPRQEVASTVGYWRHNDVTSIFFFVGRPCGHSDGGSANPPPRAIEGRRGDVRILGGGWASSPALNTLRYAYGVEGDGRVIIVAIFLVAVGQFLHPGSVKLPALAT